MGSKQSGIPVLAFFGGVHGLEKIGIEIICAYLQTLVEFLRWDKEFAARLEKSRLVFFPIVNPVGVFRGTRSNGNGVDLMRNSPIRCSGDRNIYSGHRISPRLPGHDISIDDPAWVIEQLQRFTQLSKTQINRPPKYFANYLKPDEKYTYKVAGPNGKSLTGMGAVRDVRPCTQANAGGIINFCPVFLSDIA